MLSLTLPQFLRISSEIPKLSSDIARDEIFVGVVAALGGKETFEMLKNSCGSVFIEDVKNTVSRKHDVTPEMIDRANMKLKAIMAERSGKAK